MLDIQRTSSLSWRFETARLEDNTIVGSSFFSAADLIYKNVKLLGMSQEKRYFRGQIQRWPGRCRRATFKLKTKLRQSVLMIPNYAPAKNHQYMA
jgi:hypothetical protein